MLYSYGLAQIIVSCIHAGIKMVSSLCSNVVCTMYLCVSVKKWTPCLNWPLLRCWTWLLPLTFWMMNCCSTFLGSWITIYFYFLIYMCLSLDACSLIQCVDTYTHAPIFSSRCRTIQMTTSCLGRVCVNTVESVSDLVLVGHHQLTHFGIEIDCTVTHT